jgi:hypothetical protein
MEGQGRNTYNATWNAVVQPESILHAVESEGEDASDDLTEAKERIQEEHDQLAARGVEIHLHFEM